MFEFGGVYHEALQKPIVKERVFLKMKEDPQGTVAVYAVDKDGAILPAGMLLIFRKDITGKLYLHRCQGVNSNLSDVFSFSTIRCLLVT